MIVPVLRREVRVEDAQFFVEKKIYILSFVVFCIPPSLLLNRPTSAGACLAENTTTTKKIFSQLHSGVATVPLKSRGMIGALLLVAGIPMRSWRRALFLHFPAFAETLTDTVA